jgi:F-type H+-transporting ATPase subunit epsilon
MADSFQLRVVTPKRQLFEAPVQEVTAPGTAGEFGVLPNHVTFLGSLEIGEFRLRTAQGEQRLAVRGGFAEVANNVMTVLVEDAIFAKDVDPAAARKDAEAAAAELKDLSPVNPEYAVANANLRWAETRLAVAK